MVLFFSSFWFRKDAAETTSQVRYETRLLVLAVASGCVRNEQTVFPGKQLTPSERSCSRTECFVVIVGGDEGFLDHYTIKATSKTNE